MDLHAQRILIDGEIPTLLWRGEGTGRRPAMVYMHGGSGRKEEISVAWVQRATAQGVSVVAIDAYLHGERGHGAPDFDTLGAFSQVQFLDIVGHTARDLVRVVTWLHEDDAIDGERIGLRGGSMGGYIVLAATGLGTATRAVVSVCGGASYADVWPSIFAAQPSTLPAIEALMDEIAQRAGAFDPLYRAHQFPPRSILMIHGERDPVVPVHCARRLYDALVPRYAERPGDCLFLSHAGDHGTPMVLEEWGWDWLISQVRA